VRSASDLAVLEELLGEDPGLHLASTAAAGPHRGSNWAEYPGGPHAKVRDVHPVAGMLVPQRGTPGRDWGVELLVTVSSSTPGIVGFDKIALDWTADGKRGRTVLPDGFVLCTPATLPQSKCNVRLPSP
jgi:hypothetical protein